MRRPDLLAFGGISAPPPWRRRRRARHPALALAALLALAFLLGVLA